MEQNSCIIMKEEGILNLTETFCSGLWNAEHPPLLGAARLHQEWGRRLGSLDITSPDSQLPSMSKEPYFGSIGHLWSFSAAGQSTASLMCVSSIVIFVRMCSQPLGSCIRKQPPIANGGQIRSSVGVSARKCLVCLLTDVFVVCYAAPRAIVMRNLRLGAWCRYSDIRAPIWISLKYVPSVLSLSRARTHTHVCAEL